MIGLLGPTALYLVGFRRRNRATRKGLFKRIWPSEIVRADDTVYWGCQLCMWSWGLKAARRQLRKKDEQEAEKGKVKLHVGGWAGTHECGMVPASRIGLSLLQVSDSNELQQKLRHWVGHHWAKCACSSGVRKADDGEFEGTEEAAGLTSCLTPVSWARRQTLACLSCSSAWYPNPLSKHKTRAWFLSGELWWSKPHADNGNEWKHWHTSLSPKAILF